uniref:Derlin n=1 Tax=Salmo salar TaxID=8030 RepID=B5X7N0_SALSA|nr:Derlin-1 [Salmo salar]
MSAPNTNGQSAIESFLYSMPRLTKYWFTLSLVFTLVGRFNPSFYAYFELTYESAVKNFEVWRFFTSALTFPLNSQGKGYTFLITMYLLYNMSSSLQKGDYSEREGDYFYLLLICSALLWVVALFIIPIGFVWESLVMSILYIWAQLNADTEVSFLFGIRIKAMYLPYVIFGLEFILFFGGLMTLIGIVVGHIYFFLAYKYPIEFGGRDFIVTPEFIKRFLPNVVEKGPNRTAINPRQTADSSTNTRGHSWGRGTRLDD